MNTPRGVPSTLPLTIAQQIDAVCEQFEVAWRTGQRPELAAYIGDVPDTVRQRLVLELIQLDAFYRRQAGDTLTAADYQAQFPDLDPELVAAAAVTVSDAPSLPLPTAPGATRVKGYELGAELGRGGMGVVYEARHTELNRTVALKMIRAGEFASKAEQERFRIEAEAVARLQHPNIVQVFEVGEWTAPGGTVPTPYFALEYVSGGTLATKLNRTPQLARQAAELIEVLARAVHHAHEKGIVHRDLKPANVLLAPDGTPKVTDFGLAKRLDAEEHHTRTGAILGTPSYMSPEQAVGDPKAIGPAADVWALGAILYECLTGNPPFKGESPITTLELVRTQDPVPPRRVLSTVPRDLETICLKCLTKERGKRYPTAADLANDLRRYLNGEPIVARPTPAWERGWKWVRRRPLPASMITLSVLAAGTILVGWVLFTQQLQDEKAQAQSARDEAQTERDLTAIARDDARDKGRIAEIRRVEADDQRKRAVEEKENADRQFDRARRMLFTSQILRVASLYETEPTRAIELLEDQGRCPRLLRDFTWSYYHAQSHRKRAVIEDPNSPQLGSALAFTPDGQSLWIGGANGAFVRRWDMRTKTLHQLKTRSPVAHLPLNADASLLAIRAVDSIQLFDLKQNQVHKVVPIPLPRTGNTLLALTGDGQTLAIHTSAGPVRLWNVEAQTPLRELSGHQSDLNKILFSPNGRFLAGLSGGVAGRTGLPEVIIWDVATGQVFDRPYSLKRGKFSDAVFSSDSRTLCVAHGWYDNYTENEVKVWDLIGRREVCRLRGHYDHIYSVAMSHDGKTVASGSWHEVRVWDLPEGKHRMTFRAHGGPVHGLAFTPDGQTLATGTSQSQFAPSVILWDLTVRPKATRVVNRWGGNELYRMSVSADGQWIAFAGSSVLLQRPPQNPSQTQDVRVPFQHNMGPLTITQDGKTVLYVDKDYNAAEKVYRSCRVCSHVIGSSEAPTILGEVTGEIRTMSCSPDGQVIALCAEETALRDLTQKKAVRMNKLQLWHRDRKAPIAELQQWPRVENNAPVTVSPDGKFVFAVIQGKLQQWDAATGQLLHTMPWVTTSCLAVSPNGQILAAGRNDGWVNVIPLVGERRMTTLRGHTQTANSLAFTDDSATLATASSDGTIRLWDTATWEERAKLQSESARVNSVVFTADGRSLLSAGSDGKIFVWEAPRAPDPYVPRIPKK